MDNEQQPEEEQPEQPASSEASEPVESITNEIEELSSEPLAINESRRISELIQDNVKSFRRFKMDSSRFNLNSSSGDIKSV